MGGIHFGSKLANRVVSEARAEVVREMMMLEGNWGEVVHVSVLLCDAIQFCRCDKKGYEGDLEGLKTVEVLAERLVELGRGPCWREVLQQAFQSARFGCLKILCGKGLCPGSEEMEEWAEVLFENLKYIEPNQEDDYEIGNQYEIFEYLIEEMGVRIDVVPKKHQEQYRTLLHCFAEAADSLHAEWRKEQVELYEKILDLFIRHGLDVHSVPVGELIRVGHCGPSIVKILARTGLDVTLYEEDPWTFLHSFSTKYDTEILEILLQQGAKVDHRAMVEDGLESYTYYPDEYGCTPLMLTMFRLLKWTRGSTSPKGREEMRASVQDGSHPFLANIQLFLKHGADTLIVSREGFTAITVALVLGFPNLIKDMVELDLRREERYGSLTWEEVRDKWEKDDDLWKRLLPGARTRFDLEPRFVPLPWVDQEEIEFLELKGRKMYPANIRNNPRV